MLSVLSSLRRRISFSRAISSIHLATVAEGYDWLVLNTWPHAKAAPRSMQNAAGRQCPRKRLFVFDKIWVCRVQTPMQSHPVNLVCRPGVAVLRSSNSPAMLQVVGREKRGRDLKVERRVQLPQRLFLTGYITPMPVMNWLP
jgi:hypothetical protein